jgi:hypothetical protein
MRTLRAILAICALLPSAIAFGQPQPVRVRGTIEAMEGSVLTLATREGERVNLTLTDATGINGLERKSASDIGANTFIGTTAVKGGDGRWKATEVHIFPEAMRGAGEGHYAWDLPESTMTNAAVTGTTGRRSKRTLSLRYGTGATAGEVEVDLTRKTEIVALTHGERALRVPGAAVFALAIPAATGPATAIAVVAETDGVEPPM